MTMATATWLSSSRKPGGTNTPNSFPKIRTMGPTWFQTLPRCRLLLTGKIVRASLVVGQAFREEFHCSFAWTLVQ